MRFFLLTDRRVSGLVFSAISSRFFSVSFPLFLEAHVMRRQYFYCLGALLTLAIALVFAPAAFADSYPASGGNGSSVQSDYSGTSGGWVVESPTGGNQDVYYDPKAGPWIKTLNLGAPAVIGKIYTLQELLHVGNGPDGLAPGWTDYHEEIRTPGWTWNPIGPAGEQWGFNAQGWIGNWTYVIPVGNKQVDWTFNPPLPFCTNLSITKYLVYDGTGDPQAPVVVAQYPTIPEPGTLALAAMAVAALGFWFWRRRK
jgi:hypothetical protein